MNKVTVALTNVAKARPTEEWLALIEQIKPFELATQVASIVWWDLVDIKPFPEHIKEEWRLLMSFYRSYYDIDLQALEQNLTSLGYINAKDRIKELIKLKTTPRKGRRKSKYDIHKTNATSRGSFTELIENYISFQRAVSSDWYGEEPYSIEMDRRNEIQKSINYGG